MRMGPSGDLFGIPKTSKGAHFSLKSPFRRPRRSSGSPGGFDFGSTAICWFNGLGLKVNTHLDLVSGLFSAAWAQKGYLAPIPSVLWSHCGPNFILVGIWACEMSRALQWNALFIGHNFSPFGTTQLEKTVGSLKGGLAYFAVCLRICHFWLHS